MSSSSLDIHSQLDAKDYAGAATSLLAKMQESGTTTAWQEAALGASLYHQNDVGGAVTHTQNAVLMDRWNKIYRNNLVMAQNKVEGGLGESMSHPSDWGFALATWVRPKESASLAFLVLNAFLLLRFFKRPHLTRDLALGVVVLAFLGLSAVGFYGEDIGVVAQNTSLRRQPVESAAEIRSLPAGARVRKIRDSGDFVEIERSEPGTFRGWIKKSDLNLFF
ncbi:MAG TPA: hypothetical protein VM901_13745 [Bdellovibrionota bacterium]|jgi:hypothetical protein|nr:hypothetical protein [Bdellovibrionota bacterium]